MGRLPLTRLGQFLRISIVLSVSSSQALTRLGDIIDQHTLDLN